MTNLRSNPWLKTIALTIAMPLLGFVILGLWWRITFHWEKDYVQPFYWAPLVLFAWLLIASTPIPLLWVLIRTAKRKKFSSVRHPSE